MFAPLRGRAFSNGRVHKLSCLAGSRGWSSVASESTPSDTETSSSESHESTHTTQASSSGAKDTLARLSPAVRRKLEGHLRVDHAGEWGAVRIYQGQLDVLGKTGEGATLEEMAEHEKVHLRKFNELLPEYRVRPTLLLPFWDAAGYALGFGSALLGKEAAYAVTVAVETVITEHYNDQLRFVHQTEELQDEKELRQIFKQFRDDEQEHLDIGLERDAEKAPFYQAITNVVHTGCKSAIYLAKRF
mmetsp:Transcript_38273/g.83257  ORF Transcript_38273/g.83257 Transcript_38273/m.83257 type:complete len:245 (+) Transcript_38273:234-968(+)|eukprot:CAMPEP_0118940560 /NCGR_PEP_ID=MMETSP1169-20130426/31746_1 /TAXON_ID=36882 /ORGANISM="Pyramimonas obovata, Strain CCMP722" /LENGTH=244 /DNA_ID=CAMNT_0006885085 /DNA_START=185 /DNA_END=919 /DNA_ORIENTATION=+